MRNVLFIILVVLAEFSFGQAYEIDPCEGDGNADLKNWSKGEAVSSLYLFGCGPGWADKISTSFLKTSGKPPTKPTTSEADGEIMDEWEDYRLAYDEWTCKYGGNNLMDRNPATAWVEGVDGYGVGEMVMLLGVDATKPVEIWNGYGKSETLHKYNSRVKTAKIYIVKSKVGGATQCGTIYQNIEVVTSMKVELKDVNGYQTLKLPAYKVDSYEYQGEQRTYNYWPVLEILDYYPGTKWKDTCISEVRNSP